VCPPAPAPRSPGPAPSDMQNISTWPRVGSHPFPSGSSTGSGSRVAPPSPPRSVSTCACSRINLVPVRAVCPGAGPGAPSGAGHWSAAASTILGSRTRRCDAARERGQRYGPGNRRRHPSTGPTGGTSRFTGAWIRSVSSTRYAGRGSMTEEVPHGSAEEVRAAS
jgi:hypothetical protein